MPRHSPVHTASLEAESAARKLLTAVKRRRNGGIPSRGEHALNAYNLGIILQHHAETLSYLIDEHSTLSPDLVGVPREHLVEAHQATTKAARALPQTFPAVD